ncbi:DinB family protein [Sinomicrobium kalidii]|uniref:DinB family protein n=1 Tax=Sinomicrobium kalidii TaxID=2900738 RepID=UPI001E3AC406|nr:DinB family protein [Sinomicrobium kalidii]UGU17894.1 DinB family protein [Sinomicrobium kalidii]
MKTLNRRNFIKQSSLFTVGAGSMFTLAGAAPGYPVSPATSENDLNIIGPKAGFSPQIGTLVSMLNWMRNTILYPVKGLSVEDLDYIHDENSNSIGAMLMHLAATERFYQLHTFEGRKWGDWPEEDVEKWSIASGLGDEARKNIKGHELDFYLDALKEVREHSLAEFAKRDDDWLMKADKDWPWGPTNNYCKWFHVCEHESNHNGQVKWLRSRLPSSEK